MFASASPSRTSASRHGATQPVLEIGGTHVTAALVDVDTWAVLAQARRALDANASADVLLDAFADAARELDGVERPCHWGAAFPGPFDYVHGIGDFGGVEKFAALSAVDISRALIERLSDRATGFTFVNDGDAFGMGAWMEQDPKPHRALFLTLGTGVGSGFVVDGRAVVEGAGVPLDGEVHFLQWNGRPLEETVSRRALMRDYTDATGQVVDVREIAERARQGDATAARVLESAMRALGACLAPVVESFGAECVVVGGSMTGSWDLLHPSIAAGLGSAPNISEIPVYMAASAERAAIVGVARAVQIASAETRDTP